MDPITTFKGKSVALNIPNIDTDQVTPANFTKVTDKQGLGKILFAHWRYKTPSWEPQPDFPLNKPGAQGASILVAGDNYGCGSSREHAPWAMADYGIRALISTSVADIHRGNCLKNGILPIIVDEATHKEALAAGEKNEVFEVDLPAQALKLPSGKKVQFQIDPFSKHCLVNGLDEIGYAQSHAAKVLEYEKHH